MKRILIFVWYLLTQPFIELWNIIKALFEKGAVLNYPRTWQFVFLVLTIFAYLAKNSFVTNIFGILLIITIIKTEWDKGLYMERWRARLDKRAEKELAKQQGEQK